MHFQSKEETVRLVDTISHYSTIDRRINEVNHNQIKTTEQNRSSVQGTGFITPPPLPNRLKNT